MYTYIVYKYCVKGLLICEINCKKSAWAAYQPKGTNRFGSQAAGVLES